MTAMERILVTSEYINTMVLILGFRLDKLIDGEGQDLFGTTDNIKSCW